MAAQDLIISRRSPVGTSGYLDSDSSAGDPTGPDGAAVIFSTLKSRWLLLVVIGVVSAGLASLAAWQFSRRTAVVKAAIIYTGLPSSSTVGAFDPLGAATGAEMITSVKVLKQLCDKRGLDIPPAKMADFVTAGVGRSSSYINLSLTWADVDEGITILNELAGIFINEMTTQRQEILKQNLQHLEMTLLQAKGRVDDARSQLNDLRAKQNDQLNKGGLTSEQYRTALSSAGAAKSKVDDRVTEQTAIKAQVVELTNKIGAISSKQREIEDRTKEELLRQAQTAIIKAREGWAPSSPGLEQVNQTYATIAQFIKSPTAPKDFDQWQQKLAEFLQNSSNGLPDANRKKLGEGFAAIAKAHDPELKELSTQMHRLQDQRDQMQLHLTSIENQIATLKGQQSDYENRASSLGAQITGVSTNQLDESKHLLEEAEKLQDTLTVQRDAVRQLSESHIREWTVTVPASIATAQINSNRSKVFVLVFGLCCFALSAPLFVAEWHAQTGTPQVQLARSLRVPILAERILQHFSPHARTKESAAAMSAHDMETLRMLTLRIQQSCHRPGSVVLFSSLDPKFSAAPLMTTVAECLAEREERVLLIDAVCPQRSLLPVLNVLAPNVTPALPAPKKSKRGQADVPPEPVAAGLAANTSGLSEYLSEECEDLGELVQPTGCPGVDLISSGRRGFSREAMASSCLTQLLNTCRKNYTMVLVHGPAVDSAADLQMLTARADGIVLTATKESGKDPRARALVEDLLELGAPLIGLVA